MADYNPFTLKGKKILITGASSGIGRATAIECSRMGAQVIVCGRSEARLAETLRSLEGDGHCSVVGDLTSYENIGTLASEVAPLDGVVFSAGKVNTQPFPFCTRDKFDDVFNINFFSPVELMRLLVKKKKLKKGSSVVFILSTGGTARHNVANSVYDASKAALYSMVKSCAVELKSKEIRVNGVSPAMIVTPLTKIDSFSAEQVQASTSAYLLKRYGKPEEVAYAAVYLLSDATVWVTGHSIYVDGGLAAH